jgi:diaminopimelate epimerase
MTPMTARPAAGMPLPATEFFKMSAGGNDFVVFDDRDGRLGHGGFPSLVRHLCTRALSVGADGVILIGTSDRAHVRARFFNPDGGETFCGNGARCAARLAYLQGLAPARLTVETGLMVHQAEVHGTDVSFEMRDPTGFEDGIALPLEGETIRATFVDTGVPHVVVVRDIPADRSIDAAGRAIRFHARFAPAGANVNFIHPGPDGAIAIRTYERGVEGETLACGTGAVAAALAAAAGTARPPVRLVARSGEILRVTFSGDPRHARAVRLEGTARLVYVGQLTDEAAGGFAAGR